MAATIKKSTGLDSDLVRGSGGIFDVSIENEMLFSKRAEGRFPSEAEIVEKLNARSRMA